MDHLELSQKADQKVIVYLKRFVKDFKAMKNEIDYQKSDQLDLVIRLMGYGSTIQFKKEDDPIYIETKRRLECQLKHMAENECK